MNRVLKDRGDSEEDIILIPDEAIMAMENYKIGTLDRTDDIFIKRRAS